MQIRCGLQIDKEKQIMLVFTFLHGHCHRCAINNLLIDPRVPNWRGTLVDTTLSILTVNSDLHIVLGTLTVRIPHLAYVTALIVPTDVVQDQAAVLVVVSARRYLARLSSPVVLERVQLYGFRFQSNVN